MMFAAAMEKLKNYFAFRLHRYHLRGRIRDFYFRYALTRDDAFHRTDLKVHVFSRENELILKIQWDFRL